MLSTPEMKYWPALLGGLKVAKTVQVLSSLIIRWRLWSLRDLAVKGKVVNSWNELDADVDQPSSWSLSESFFLLRPRPRTKEKGFPDRLDLLAGGFGMFGDPPDGKGGNTVRRCGWEKVRLCGETRTVCESNVSSWRRWLDDNEWTDRRSLSERLSSKPWLDECWPLFRQRPKAALICCCSPVMLLPSVNIPNEFELREKPSRPQTSFKKKLHEVSLNFYYFKVKNIPFESCNQVESHHAPSFRPTNYI